MPTLAAFLLADAIAKEEEPKLTPKELEEQKQKQKAPPPDADLASPEQVNADRSADKARDLKRRAREASYTALELENSKANHAKAAKAHHAAAKASEKALANATDPRAKSEFRSSQHSHNLHAAYHDKMSHSKEEERKASAEKGKEGKAAKAELRKAWSEAAREAAAQARQGGGKKPGGSKERVFTVHHDTPSYNHTTGNDSRLRAGTKVTAVDATDKGTVFRHEGTGELHHVDESLYRNIS